MATYLNKIKILDGENQTSSTTPFNFGIGTLREEGGNIVYDGDDGKQKILLAKGTTEGTYTLEGTVLQAYMDQRDTFLKDVKYKDGYLIFTFQLSTEDEETVQTINVPVNDFAIDADNIYLTKDLIVTEPVGVITQKMIDEGNGRYTAISLKDKNNNPRQVSVEQAFSELFAVEKNPSKTDPSVTVALNKAGSYEAGTELTGITYSATFEDGKYQYGPEPTGVTVTAWEAKTNGGVVVGTTASGPIADMEVAADTNYYLTFKATYSAGSYAKTNLGNESTVSIAAGSKTKNTSAIKGYRNTFYGTISDANTALTSDVIRGLTSSNATLAAGDTFTIDIPSTAAKAIIAVPKGLGISSVKHEEGLWAPVLSTFTPQEISVEGANKNAAITYDVYVASVGYSSTNHYHVII